MNCMNTMPINFSVIFIQIFNISTFTHNLFTSLTKKHRHLVRESEHKLLLILLFWISLESLIGHFIVTEQSNDIFPIVWCQRHYLSSLTRLLFSCLIENIFAAHKCVIVNGFWHFFFNGLPFDSWRCHRNTLCQWNRKVEISS